MSFDRNAPYNELPPLPPKAELETRAVLKACIAARSALAALKEAGDLIPNQAMLINTIPVLEARASSEIENIVTTTDALFRHANISESKADAATREALRYRSALWRGIQSVKDRPLCANTAIEICTMIKAIDMDVRRVPGTALANPLTGEVVYTPAEGEALLRTMLANWESFLHGEEEIDPLVRMAIAHYQFEAIHPFTDGNGRTGRIVNLIFLVEKGLLTVPVLYLSRYILEHKADYYRLLREVTEAGEWETWLLFMLAAITETADWTRAKIAAVRELLTHTADYVRHRLPRIYSSELINVVFNQPYCRIQNLVEAGIVKRQAASEYLNKMAVIGVLEEKKSGRDKLFVQPKLLRLLAQESNEFARYDL